MKKLLSVSVLLILALALAGPAVLADDTATTGTTTDDPVAVLTAYLQQANAPVETITAVTAALNEALASDAVKADPLVELIQAMIKAEVTPEVALQIAHRVDLMAKEDLPFGQVMKEFRLLIKEGKNKGIDQALAQAEKFVAKREGKSENAPEDNTTARGEAGKGNAGENKGGKK